MLYKSEEFAVFGTTLDFELSFVVLWDLTIGSYESFSVVQVE